MPRRRSTVGRRLRHVLAVPVVASAVVALSACIELTVDPKQIAAIEFLAPPNPGIVLGDTLRDTLGVAVRLQAKVFDAGGDLVPDAPLYFVATDTFTHLAGGNYLVANKDTVGTSKVYAVTGQLQSVVRTMAIIRAPDSIAFSPATEDTIRIKVPATGTSIDTSKAITVRVRSGAQLVNAVRVRFEFERRGTILAPKDTATYAMVTTGARLSAIDTTDASGNASRTIRVRATAGTPVTDTIVVLATATIGGVLKSKPARKTILILPSP